jgi:hypothetical protein
MPDLNIAGSAGYRKTAKDFCPIPDKNSVIGISIFRRGEVKVDGNMLFWSSHY